MIDMSIHSVGRAEDSARPTSRRTKSSGLGRGFRPNITMISQNSQRNGHPLENWGSDILFRKKDDGKLYFHLFDGVQLVDAPPYFLEVIGRGKVA